MQQLIETCAAYGHVESEFYNRLIQQTTVTLENTSLDTVTLENTSLENYKENTLQYNTLADSVVKVDSVETVVDVYVKYTRDTLELIQNNIKRLGKSTQSTISSTFTQSIQQYSCLLYHSHASLLITLLNTFSPISTYSNLYTLLILPPFTTLSTSFPYTSESTETSTETSTELSKEKENILKTKIWILRTIVVF
jgi:hypothetical protein